MRAQMPSRRVYFVQVGDQFGPVKIGVTNNISTRVAMLQTGSPTKISCIAIFDFGTEEAARVAESAFHTLFEDRRLEGEWFAWSDEFVDLLKGMLQIEKFFGPTGQQLNVSFDIVRLAGGGIRFRPKTANAKVVVDRIKTVAAQIQEAESE